MASSSKVLWIRLSLAMICLTPEAAALNKRRHGNEAGTRRGAMNGNRKTELPAGVLGNNNNYSQTGSNPGKSGYKTWSLDSYPNPQKDPERCGRSVERSFICDPDGVLSLEEADSLDIKLNRICVETRCACQSCESPWFQHQDEECHGYKIAIAVVYNINNNTQLDESDEEGQRWTRHLREKTWKFGMCGDDVILLLVASLHKVYVSVGPKAGEVLTPDCVSKGLSDGKPHILHAQYFNGLKDMVHLYGRVFKSQKSDLCKPESSKPLHPAAIAVIALFSAFTVVIVIGAICCVWGTCKKGDRGAAKRKKTSSPDCDSCPDRRRAGSPVLDPVEVSLTRPTSDSGDDDPPDGRAAAKSRDRAEYGAAHAQAVKRDVKYKSEHFDDEITSLNNTETPLKPKSYEDLHR